MNELNKYIYTDEFFKLYPEIPDSTFWRWTRTGKSVWIKKNGKKIRSPYYILPLIRRENCGHGKEVKISPKALEKFFKQIGEEEWALRVPSYTRRNYEGLRVYRFCSLLQGSPN